MRLSNHPIPTTIVSHSCCCCEPQVGAGTAPKDSHQLQPNNIYRHSRHTIGGAEVYSEETIVAVPSEPDIGWLVGREGEFES
jgi:hypothetical protein